MVWCRRPGCLEAVFSGCLSASGTLSDDAGHVQFDGVYDLGRANRILSLSSHVRNPVSAVFCSSSGCVASTFVSDSRTVPLPFITGCATNLLVCFPPKSGEPICIMPRGRLGGVALFRYACSRKQRSCPLCGNKEALPVKCDLVPPWCGQLSSLISACIAHEGFCPEGRHRTGLPRTYSEHRGKRFHGCLLREGLDIPKNAPNGGGEVGCPSRACHWLVAFGHWARTLFDCTTKSPFLHSPELSIVTHPDSHYKHSRSRWRFPPLLKQRWFQHTLSYHIWVATMPTPLSSSVRAAGVLMLVAPPPANLDRRRPTRRPPQLWIKSTAVVVRQV